MRSFIICRIFPLILTSIQKLRYICLGYYVLLSLNFIWPDGNLILGPNQGCFGFRTKWTIFRLRQKLFSHENFLEECVESGVILSTSIWSSRPYSRNQIAQSDPVCPWSQKLLTILLLSPTHAAWSAALAIETKLVEMRLSLLSVPNPRDVSLYRNRNQTRACPSC